MEVEATDRYRHVVEEASDGVFELDVDGIVQYANPAMAGLLGTGMRALVGRPVTEVLPRVHPGVPDVVIDLACEGEVVRRVRVRQFERVHDGVVTGWDAVLVEP
jgi:PAS domain S-box-containing protein